MAETIEQVQAEVRENFVALEADIRGVAEPEKRAEFLRDLAALKAEAAPLIRDDLGLQGYRPEMAHADYRGLAVPADARAAAIKVEADRAVARLAEGFGLQPEATVVRFGGEAVSVGLGRDYRAEELAERAADRAARGEQAERVDEATAQLAEFHRRAGTVYREAAERLRALERRDPRGAPEVGTSRDAADGRAERGAGGRDQAADADRSASASPRRDEPSAERADPRRPVGRRRDRDDDDRSR